MLDKKMFFFKLFVRFKEEIGMAHYCSGRIYNISYHNNRNRNRNRKSVIKNQNIDVKRRKY